MIEFIKPKKIETYVNKSLKPINVVKSETGCSHIMNSVFFNSDLSPCCHVKVNGIVLSSDADTYWGYAWNQGDDIQLVNNYSNYSNFISGCCLVRNKQPEVLYYRPEVGGKRGRSVIATMPDNRVMLYCTQDGTLEAKTPYELRSEMLDLGVRDAVMFDGGQSSQCDFNGNRIMSDREVPYLFLVWNNIAQPNQPKTIFRIQCGAFSIYENGIKLRDSIRAIPDTINAGYKNAYIRQINGLYKVQIGAYTQKSGAEKVLNDLIQRGFPAFVTTQ